MSEKPISPLRRHMIEDMTVRNFVEETRNNYIRHVRTFTTFLGRAPGYGRALRIFAFSSCIRRRLGCVHIEHQCQPVCSAAFLLHRDARPPRDSTAPHMIVREPRRIPAILSLEEIARLLEAAPGPKVQRRR